MTKFYNQPNPQAHWIMALELSKNWISCICSPSQISCFQKCCHYHYIYHNYDGRILCQFGTLIIIMKSFYVSLKPFIFLKCYKTLFASVVVSRNVSSAGIWLDHYLIRVQGTMPVNKLFVAECTATSVVYETCWSTWHIKKFCPCVRCSCDCLILFSPERDVYETYDIEKFYNLVWHSQTLWWLWRVQVEGQATIIFA